MEKNLYCKYMKEKKCMRQYEYVGNYDLIIE